jgi:hypothetical protein
MADLAPTTAPAASAPPPSAPAPAAAPATPASTPFTPSKPTPPGGINPSFAKSIFDALDAEPVGAGEGGEASVKAAEIPVAQVPSIEPTKEPGAEPAAAAPDVGEQLPVNIREALKKSGLDPKLQSSIADAWFIKQDLSKHGTPLPALRQFIADAPKYLTLAPTYEVLETMAETAQVARSIAEGFKQATPEGFQQFTGALLQQNPAAVVGWLDFMLRNVDGLASGFRQHFGGELADTFVSQLDSFVDQRVLNGIAQMRKRAEEARAKGDEDNEVWDEVAGYVEKFFGLSPEARQAAAVPGRPDPRDMRIKQLESERQQVFATRVEQFTDGVFNQAGTALDTELKQHLAEKCKGLPPKVIQRIYKEIGGENGALYRELLKNPHVSARAKAIEQNGRYDKEHFQKLSAFYIDAGKHLLANVAAPIITEYAEFAVPAAEQRKEQLERHVNRRDPGASGAPAISGAPKPQLTGTPKDIFNALDAQAQAEGLGF